ncbi:MacB family efflux pump subunit [Stenotrophomonas sp. ATCM1_4]|uniref:Pyoverdine export ATP-binding/permease protein PvdT n=1 Tax=Stenotrophomonas capsici TaxID=3110230 RepID=A0ABU5V6F9_9GAMM|nr:MULTISPECIES: MacB family efflux pump subunit [unclassified Stenotrophomonas]MEA5668950.1 MacB family efflux pump subunit [Stenotrophomonas sp. MH1]TDB26568.1 MacB family efflux pump subunit [Stenotrophomonas sp. ATCM1_4]
MSQPLLQLRELRREFPAGEETIAVLKDVNLDIHAGEMVAIVGQSGSGKSTLMNILGCLDRPTVGSYRVAGRETGRMQPDELAQLRREHFGFIFQRYHLLGDLDARGNVEVPAIYAGTPAQARRSRAEALLARLGLSDRMGHTPGQLSGGQQQRVSIARALMNGGEVILADEPTGALDSASGEEVMKILGELHAEGHTIIIVTHDMHVAEHAQRIIEIRDGVIIDDRRNDAAPRFPAQQRATPVKTGGSAFQAARDRFLEAFRMALLAMNAHRLRTFLTMLGIIIGIASVVSVVAMGNGSQQEILKNISALGTNTIDVYPGKGFGDMRSARVQTLKSSDADVLAQQSYIDSATPSVSSSVTARVGNKAASAQVSGIGEQYFRVKGMTLVSGRYFDESEVKGLAQVVVIDENTRTQLFGSDDPLGKVVLLGNVPARVIGIAKRQSMGFGGSTNLSVWVPYTTVMARMLGQSYLSSITLRVKDDTPMDAAQSAITRLLTLRHGTEDFFLSNTAEIRETIASTTRTMTLLIGAIAAIALVVGGIGVMNIMLVSVTERTREIGVRMAVGARQSDIRQQFLIEAVLVCLLGGILGIVLALAIGWAFRTFGASFTLLFSTGSIVAAFACSTLIGVAFGFLPARNAAQLDPVEALARE